MKTKPLSVRMQFFSLPTLSLCIFLAMPAFFSGAGVRAENGKIFSVDAEKQKADLEKAIDRVQELLSALKFQDARGAIELADHKLDRVKKDLSNQDAQTFAEKIDKAKKMMTAKEDSLVNITFTILKDKGSDTALLYTQSELRSRGVPETKISAAEKRVLEEGPAIKQAKDQEELAKTVKLLENGQTPPQSTDIFIVQSAQRVVKRRADSVKAVADAKAQKELQLQQRQEAIQKEKETKEKQQEEQRLAKQRKEEEKKRLEAQEAEKKRLAEERQRQKQLQTQQEKARRDSIETIRKIAERKEAQLYDSLKRVEDAQNEKQRLVREEQDRQNKALAAQRQKALNDSMETARKITQRKDAQRRDSLKRMETAELEKQRMAQERSRQKKEQLAQQEKFRKDSVETARKIVESRDAKRRDSLKRAEDARQEKKTLTFRDQERQRKSLSAQQDKALKDSLVAARKASEQLEKQQKLQFAAAEKARKDSIETQRKLLEKQAREDKRKGTDRRKDNDPTAKRDAGLQSEAVSPAGMGKSRNDSLEARRWGSIQLAKKDKRSEEEYERQRLAKLIEEEKQRKLLLALQARRDSLEAARRVQEQSRQQEENKRLARVEEERRQQRALIAQQEQVRQDNLETARKAREQLERQRKLQADQDRAARIQEQRRVETQPVTQVAQSDERPRLQPSKTMATPETQPGATDERQSITQRDEQRRRQLEVLQEKARQDYQKKLEADNAKLESERRRHAPARTHGDSVNTQAKNIRIHVEIDKDAANYDPEPENKTKQPAVISGGGAAETRSIKISTAPMQTSQEIPKNSMEKQVMAEKLVAAIYSLMEKNKNAEAQKQYKRNREFIARYSAPEVISVLEQSLTPEPQAVPAQQPAPSRPAAVVDAPPVKSVKGSAIAGHEQEVLTRINDLLQDNNVAAAYAEFKKAEDGLRSYLTKDEFGNFKAMIETAYKTRQR